jgi:katanin p60 ATPase-containing subunit A1
VPVKGNNEKNIDKDKPDPKIGKSPFYLYHYPEGEGPDGELIEMVEREVMDKNPNVKFEDIAELEGAKNTLKEAVLLPLLMPDFFRGIRRPWKGVLLYGPPGTGKTLLAKALATQGKTTFFNVSPTTFASKWKGESEKLVRILFEMARFYAPSTIFIDEVDSIGQKRGDGDNEASRKVMAEMLVQMDGVSGKLDQEDISIEELKKNIVMVMGATNLPWDLDDALRRRFEKRVYIPLPNEKGRKEMFNINMKGIKVDNNIDMDKLVKLTDGYSGADIANVCREASLMQMRRELMKTGGKLNFTKIKLNPSASLINELDAPVSQQDFETAIKNISKSVSQNDIKKYDQFTQEYANN